MLVYCITNKINKKVYVGKTERTLDARWKEHIRDLKTNKCPLLYNALRKYGTDNFSIHQVAVAQTRQELDSLEKFWIEKLRSAETETGYNLTLGGTGGSLTLVSLAKMAESQKRRLASPENRAKCATRTGAIVSSETRIKMSKSQTGRTHSKETREKMSVYHKQLPPSTMAHLYTSERNDSRSQKLQGRVVSEATKEKLRLAAQRQWARIKNNMVLI